MVKEYYITVTPKFNIDIKDVVGKIEFFDTSLSDIVLEALNNGDDITITPFGTGERDEKGKIKTFNLLGFTIRKDKYNYGDFQIDFSR